MVPLERDSLLAVLRPFEEATPLPRAAFLDPRILEIEDETIFSSSWIPVAHEADLAKPGAWVRAPLRDENIVVVKTADLEVAAVRAVCTHRGTLLCDGPEGQLDSLEIVCPYHGWRYATDGVLLAAPGARPGSLPPGLARLRTETRHGVIFVNLEKTAASLRESWDGGPPWLERLHGAPLCRVHRTDSEVAANWKIVVGNFQESHHFASVHPSLEGRTPWRDSTSVVVSDAWLGGVMDLLPGFSTVSESGELQGRPVIAAAEDRGRIHDAHVFPLWLTSLQPDYLLTYRLTPLDVDRTLVVAEIHMHPSTLARGVGLEDVFTFWDRTNAEDRAICELQQRGLSGRGERPVTYAASEDGLHAFEKLVAARYLQALDERRAT